MKELTIVLDDIIDKELFDYLSSLNGINKVNINYDDSKIYVNYDDKIVSLNVLKLEILSFLKLMNIPSIVAFKKNFENDLVDYTMIINDLCCEYCLKGMIEELLLIDGIMFANSEFNYSNKKNVKIYIKYDNSIIKEDKLLEINKKFSNSSNN